MSEDKEIKQPDVSVLEHTVEEPYSGRKIMIVGNDDMEHSPRLTALMSHSLVQSKITMDSDDGCWGGPQNISKGKSKPIENEIVPLYSDDNIFRMSPQPRPSKHRNKKTYTRKKAGKKTHRKR